LSHGCGELLHFFLLLSFWGGGGGGAAVGVGEGVLFIYLVDCLDLLQLIVWRVVVFARGLYYVHLEIYRILSQG